MLRPPGGGGAPPRQRYKVVVLGARGTGKTALVRRLAAGAFDEPTTAPQRGLDFYLCHVPLRDDLAVTLQLWDVSDCPCTPGDHDPAPLAAYLFNAQAVLLLYDATSPASLEALRYAAAAVDAVTEAAGGARPYLALVAAKCDLLGSGPEPLVSEPLPLVSELAARHGCVRLAVSARSGEGVAGAALQLAADLAGVPLSATDYPQHLQQQQQQQQLLGMGSTGSAGAAAPGVGSRQQALPHPRAPAYRPSPDPTHAAAAGAFSGGGGGGGGGGGSGAWRPVSRSATPSPTTMLISKAGPFGQRGGARPASAAAAAAGAAAAGAATQEDSGGGGEGGLPGGGVAAGAGAPSPRRGRRPWRAWLCCCGG